MVAISIFAASQLFAVALGAPLFKSSLVERTTSIAYATKTGDGTMAQGWCPSSQWKSFEELWELNLPLISSSCEAFGQENNSEEELAILKKGLLQVADEAGIPAQMMLAMAVQESKACVRVWTTAYSHANPGIFQSYMGTHSCNPGGLGSTAPGMVPCPEDQIIGMIRDGAGIGLDFGLKQAIEKAGCEDDSKYYKAARIYNSGSLDPSGDLGVNGATNAYASDVENRLTGWAEDKSGFQPGAPHAPPQPTDEPAETTPIATPSAVSTPPAVTSAAPSTTAIPTTSSKPVPTSSTTAAVPTYGGDAPASSSAAAASSTAAEPTYGAPVPTYTPVAPPNKEVDPAPAQPTEKPVEYPTNSNPGSSSSEAPAERAPGVPEKCSKWYLVKENDTCESTGVDLDTLRKINTGLDARCSNLWLGYAYCLEQ